ncbi:hypothetical protein LguiA_013273 [Lonicera macranthoides]
MTSSILISLFLVDIGATSNLMYYNALTAFPFNPTSITLIGFPGERLLSLGSIKLSITFRTTRQKITIMENFLVLDRTPNYNVIISSIHIPLGYDIPYSLWYKGGQRKPSESEVLLFCLNEGGNHSRSSCSFKKPTRNRLARDRYPFTQGTRIKKLEGN